MLGIPSPTPYDVNFRFLGIPVRISPWFWLGSLMLGFFPDRPGDTLLWVLCVLISVTVHEYGHALMYRAFGCRSNIVLIALGGLTVSEEFERLKPGQRLAMLAMGPGSQLVLLVLIMLFGSTVLGIAWSSYPSLALSILGFGEPVLNITRRVDLGEHAILFLNFFYFMFVINWVWPLINLLPIWPLDGGQMTQVVLTKANKVHGGRRTHIVSMVVAGLLTFYVLRQFVDASNEGSFLRVFFFAWFVWINYQMLQAYQRRYEVYGPEDDADWWKR